MRTAVSMAAALFLVVSVPLGLAPAWAIEPPVIDPAAVPADGSPGPEEEMKESLGCAQPGVLPDTDVTAVPGPQKFMRLPELWQSAGRGAGVTVAVIDTGVSPSPRFPHLRGGGDYVMSGDGLQDCDSHGTVVAAIIGAAGSEGDGLVGVAPDADLVSIRQTSAAFSRAHPGMDNSAENRRAGTVTTLARAIVHAVNAGARVVNMSVVACVPVLKPVDQTTLGAAIRYAAIEKDAVLIAAAGNASSDAYTSECAQNPDIDATNTADPRNWGRVITISTPSWYSDYVLSVGATDAAGQVAVDAHGNQIGLSGPWVGVGAPGVFVTGVNDKGDPINATFNARAAVFEPMGGTSFSAAYVSGLAALVRAKYPSLSALQIINRIKQTAHAPAAVIDNRIGHGVLDPLAALNDDVPPIPLPRENLSSPLGPPPPPPPVDPRPRNVAVISAVALASVMGAVVALTALAGRQRKQ
ncbi:type VII secretion-associated serine protease mycosin [Mycolicibacter acidiphilus]|nr:type VII secretion-associated serine protease mycosin [Mycolicibacter acidiphilus]